MKLSIIIPYYNTYEYTVKLLKKLENQVTDEVEVIVVDDGCHEMRLDNITKIGEEGKGKLLIGHLQKNSGGASLPRNKGLDNATGEYIAFIDSDDDITDDYIEQILNKIKRKPDIIFLSWKSKKQQLIMNTKPPTWNCAVWCRVYKKEIIGNTRFDENLRVAEDWKFNQQIKYQKSACIRNIVYIYNNGRKGSILNE